MRCKIIRQEQGSSGSNGHQEPSSEHGHAVQHGAQGRRSRALGVVKRRGIGNMRHVGTQELWMPIAIRYQEIEVQNNDGEHNVADRLTENVKAGVLGKHKAAMRFSKTVQQGSRRSSEKQISLVSSGGEHCTPEAAAMTEMARHLR